jgi:hypothetical protein
MKMDLHYKLSILSALALIIITFWDVVKMIITKEPITIFAGGCLIFTWLLMLCFNPFWKDVWKNK